MSNLVDPTDNVKALMEASIKALTERQDLIARAAYEKIKGLEALAVLRAQHESFTATLREGYQEKVAHAEASRLDSIRQVDREEVAKTAVAANNAITTLAKQTNDLATTLAKTVADTAAAAEARNSSQYSDTNKRLSALELSSSEGKGKQQVADPQMDKLALLVEELASGQANRAGQSQGLSDGAKLLIGALALVTALMGIYTFTQRQIVAPAPQIIYVPAPATGVPLPATPQGAR